jgi:hypothetical protein
MFIPDPTPTSEQRELQASARARRIALRRVIREYRAALSPEDHDVFIAAYRARNKFLRVTGMWPERSLRLATAASLCAGDFRRAALRVGGFDGATVATERRLTEKWSDRRRAARGNYKPRTAVDRRHEQSEAQRAARKAAWTPKRRAAMRRAEAKRKAATTTLSITNLVTAAK